MTKKDYVMFAALIKQNLELWKDYTPEVKNTAHNTLFRLAKDFSKVAREDNELFDAVRFMKACGL